MKIRFTKMQGCGNDYVYVNGFTEHIPQEKKPEFVRFASDRHFGVRRAMALFLSILLTKQILRWRCITQTAQERKCAETASAAWQNMPNDKGLTDRARFPLSSGGKVKYNGS